MIHFAGRVCFTLPDAELKILKKLCVYRYTVGINMQYASTQAKRANYPETFKGS